MSRRTSTLIAITAAALLGAAALLIATHTRSPRSRTTPTARVEHPRITGGAAAEQRSAQSQKRLIAAQDGYEHNRVERRRARRALQMHAAFQAVPYHGHDIAVAIVGVDSSHRIVFAVTSRLTYRHARAAYHRWLRALHDAGDTYPVLFRTPDGTPTPSAPLAPRIDPTR